MSSIATQVTLLQLITLLVYTLYISYMGLQFLSPSNPPSRGRTWILAANEYYTKLVKAIAFKRASRAPVANFIRNNNFCGFDIPKHLLSDKGTWFINMHVHSLILMSMGLFLWSRVPFILKETVKQRLLVRHCFVFLAEWFMRNLKDGLIFYLSLYGHIILQDVLQHIPCLPL